MVEHYIQKTPYEIVRELAYLREKNKKTQMDMSRICGCSRSNINEFENGRNFSMKLVLKYMDEFGEIEFFKKSIHS